jgi:hypothetical protein
VLENGKNNLDFYVDGLQFMVIYAGDILLQNLFRIPNNYSFNQTKKLLSKLREINRVS